MVHPYLISLFDRHPLLGQLVCEGVYGQLYTGSHHLRSHGDHGFYLARRAVLAHLFHLMEGGEEGGGKGRGRDREEGEEGGGRGEGGRGRGGGRMEGEGEGRKREG